MRRTPFAALALVIVAAAPQAAEASRTLVYDGASVRVEHDPYLPARSATPPDGDPGVSARQPLAPGRAARRKTVIGELKRILRAGAIDEQRYRDLRAVYEDARRMRNRLKGRRRTELGAVIANLEAIAAGGLLTTSRLEPLFMTVRRNREWWARAPMPSSGERVRFSGSRLVWQYYPGQGLQLQMLANFGKANGYWYAGKVDDLRLLIGELVPLAARRAGGIAWEYYFRFGGGRPPWTSALSQGTALQALARASQMLADPTLLELGRQGLPVFERPPPSGVRVATSRGAHYLIYSYSSGLRVINAFVQSLNGLFDFALAAVDPRAQALFAAGDAQARDEVPRYDTGAWSLYSGTRESDLGYHKLVRDFLRELCERTTTPVYCETAEHFTGYLSEKPRLRLTTRRLRAGRGGTLRFALSKRSRVGVVVRRGKRVVLSTSAPFAYGRRAFFWRPTRAGTYSVRLMGTDLAGNRDAAEGDVRVLRAPRSK